MVGIMTPLGTLLLRLQEAQNILGDAVAKLTEEPNRSADSDAMVRRLMGLILDMQQIESSARELERSANDRSQRN